MDRGLAVRRGLATVGQRVKPKYRRNAFGIALSAQGRPEDGQFVVVADDPAGERTVEVILDAIAARQDRT